MVQSAPVTLRGTGDLLAEVHASGLLLAPGPGLPSAPRASTRVLLAGKRLTWGSEARWQDGEQGQQLPCGLHDASTSQSAYASFRQPLFLFSSRAPGVRGSQVGCEKPLDQKCNVKFKIVRLKVKGPMEYVPELFDEQKDQVAVEQIWRVVFLDAEHPSPQMDKLKRQLAEAEAALEAHKKPPEDDGAVLLVKAL